MIEKIDRFIGKPNPDFLRKFGDQLVIPFEPSLLSSLSLFSDMGYTITLRGVGLSTRENVYSSFLLFESSGFNIDSIAPIPNDLVVITNSDEEVLDLDRSIPVILPAFPLSSMFESETLKRPTRELVKWTKEFCRKEKLEHIEFKRFKIDQSRKQLQSLYPDVLEVLEQNRISLIPELYWHLVNVLTALDMIATHYGLDINRDIYEMALLHDLGKPLFLVVDHYRTTQKYISEHGLIKLKEKIVSGEVYPRRLWRYADDIMEGREPKLPNFALPYEDYTRDNEISALLVDTTPYDKTHGPLLRRLWGKSFEDNQLLVAIKLADILADYIDIITPETIQLGVLLKAKAVTRRYDENEAEILAKYSRLIEHLTNNV